ncbi:MAG: hypothetical protein HY865_00880 [Chloroflexi bacterium]|nr:hypothetical protein [Chloroflexota bacterium]
MSKSETICPHCLKPYTLGVDGVEEGCDTCMAIVRNPLDHSIVQDDFSKIFADDDTLTN